MITSGIKIENIQFKSSYNNIPIAAYIFRDETVQPRAILQICHGMAEYLMRYEKFAKFMAKNGFIVCGHDHLGHGDTSGAKYEDGFFAPVNGRYHVLKDMYQLNRFINSHYPYLPIVLLGHSMGSFFARWFCEVYPGAVDVAVFSGTGGANTATGMGIDVTAMLTTVRGPKHISNFVDNIAFGKYCKRINSPKTSFDWLCSDEKVVAAYVADKKCGFKFTVSAFNDMLQVNSHVNQKAWVKAIYKDLPILLIAGQEDPVGDYGNGPKQVAENLKNAGVERVDLIIYPEMRHEILNEKKFNLVFADILKFCNETLAV